MASNSYYGVPRSWCAQSWGPFLGWGKTPQTLWKASLSQGLTLVLLLLQLTIKCREPLYLLLLETFIKMFLELEDVSQNKATVALSPHPYSGSHCVDAPCWSKEELPALQEGWKARQGLEDQEAWGLGPRGFLPSAH